MIKMLKRYLIAGILVWAPIWITLLFIKFFVNIFDDFITLLPKAYQPDTLIGFHVPGLGVLFTILLVTFTGVLVTNFVGKRIVAFGEALLDKIPLVRSIYSGVKKVLQTILTSGDMSFRKVLLVEYPRKGIWSIAFQTSNDSLSKAEQLTGKTMVTVFVPTTPNPTSGYLIIVPHEDIIELDINIDAAIKMVISLGVILPQQKK
ncbi:MAG: hypothetical protein AMJ43_04505 [Coxiella sp. DG_40]|nr:MAG: hypothetical protein AMJ43_04505 [Coxiella sp. DG_40]